MHFSGELTSEIEKEFRDLYYKRNPLFIITYAVMGTAMILRTILMLSRNSWPYDLAFLLVGIVFLTYALALPQIYWRLWWNHFLSVFGRKLSCEVRPTGLQLKSDIPVIEWKNFTATKKTDSLILLYWTKSAAYPVHRQMASSEAEWAELQNLIKKNIRQKV